MKKHCLKVTALLMAIVMVIGLLPSLRLIADAEEVNHILQSNPVSEQKFMYTTAGWGGWLTAGEQYTISFRVKGQGHYRVTLSDWGHGVEGCTVEETLDSENWVTRTTTITAGTNWSAMIIYRHPDEGGILYFDDVIFTAADGTKYVLNGGFENGGSDWNGLNGTDFVVVEEPIVEPAEPEGPNHVLQFNAVSSTQYAYYDAWAQLNDGEEYTLSFRIKGTGTVRIGYNNWGNGAVTEKYTVDSLEWVTVEQTYKANRYIDNGWAALFIYRDPETNGGTVYIDDITVRNAAGKAVGGQEVFDFENGTEGWRSGDWQWSSICVTEEPALESTDPEPDTEPTKPEGPNHVLQFNAVSSTQYAYYDAWAQLNDGEEYTLSFRIKGTGTVRIGYNNWGNGAVTEKYTVDSLEWVTVEQTYKANRYFDNGWAALFIYRDPETNGGTVYIDDITVRNAAGKAVGGQEVFDFENGTEGWRSGDWQWSSICVTEEPTKIVDPSNLVLEITTGQPSGNGAHVATGLDIVAGETYTLTFRAKGNGTATVAIVNDNWSRLKVVKTEKSNEWVEYEVSFASGSYSGWGGFIIYDESGEAGKVVYLDDLVLKDSAGNVVKSNDFQDTSDQGLGSGWWASNGIVKNVIAETEIDFVYIEETDSDVDSGNHVLQGEAVGKYGYLYSMNVSLTGGETYTISYKLKGAGKTRVTLSEWGAGVEGSSRTDTVQSADWIDCSTTFTHDGRWVCMLIYSDPDNTGIFYVDDVVVTASDGTVVFTCDFEDNGADWNWDGIAGAFSIVSDPELDDNGIVPTDPSETVPVEDEYTVNWAENEVNVDGVFDEDEWSDADALHLSGMTGKRSMHYGTLYFKYDGNYLYMAAVVNDTTPMRNDGTGDSIWWGDSIELFYGTDLNSRKEMSEEDIQVLISGSEFHGHQNTFNYGAEKAYQEFKDMDVGLRTDDAGNAIGYVVEAVIPLELLRLDDEPWTGEQILFNANIKNESAGQVGWSNTEETGKKDPRTWKLVTFARHAAPTNEVTVETVVDRAAGIVTVKGWAEQAVRQDLTILVKDSSGAIRHIDQFQTNADGSYEYSFPIYGTGNYTVSIGGTKIAKPVSNTFTV